MEFHLERVRPNADQRLDDQLQRGGPDGCLDGCLDGHRLQVHHLKSGWNCSEEAARRRLHKDHRAQGHAERALDNCLEVCPAAGTLSRPAARCRVEECHPAGHHLVAHQLGGPNSPAPQPGKDDPNQRVRPAVIGLRAKAGLPILQADPRRAELPLQAQGTYQEERPSLARREEPAGHTVVELPKLHSLALVHHMAVVPHIQAPACRALAGGRSQEEEDAHKEEAFRVALAACQALVPSLAYLAPASSPAVDVRAGTGRGAAECTCSRCAAHPPVLGYGPVRCPDFHCCPDFPAVCPS